MVRNRLARHPAILYGVFLLILSVPYMLAWKMGGKDYVFSGFLFNPIDGYSYLAKMRLGWEGAWRFVLPFSAQPGNGAYVYLFYILLGHFARLTTFSLPMMYHLARLLGALFMVWSLNRFIKRVLPGDGNRDAALYLVTFGSGLGWVGLIAGYFTSDLWVSEAYPFLSAYNNPHFPLSLGLMVWLLTPEYQMPPEMLPERRFQFWASGWRFGIAALILAELSPFGSVLVLLVCIVLAIWDFFELKEVFFSSDWLRRTIWIGLGSGPVMLYTWMAVQADAMLAAWNAQNLTPSPAWWDVLLAFSPALPLSILGAWQAIKFHHREARPAIIWAVLALVVIYLPLGLQRRFLIGMYIPLAILAVIALQYWRGKSRVGLLALLVLVIISLPSNLVVLLAGWQGIASKDERIYLTLEETEALRWIETETGSDALILAGPESGLFIPGCTGRRVIYGHPFETVDAETQKVLLEEYYSGKMSREEAWEMIERRGIDFIYHGPREQRISLIQPPLPEEHLDLAYVNQSIAIYRVMRERFTRNIESAGSP